MRTLVGRQAVELCTCVVGGGWWFVEGELVWSVTMQVSQHQPLGPRRRREVVWWGTLPTSAFNASLKSGGEARKRNYDRY